MSTTVSGHTAHCPSLPTQSSSLGPQAIRDCPAARRECGLAGAAAGAACQAFGGQLTDVWGPSLGVQDLTCVPLGAQTRFKPNAPHNSRSKCLTIFLK